MIFHYIHDNIIILSPVYNEPTQWPAPSWLVSLIGRGLHRYCTGQGIKSHTSLNFSGFLFATAKVASITAMIIFHLIFISVFSLQAHYIRGLLVSADGTWDTVPSLGLKAYLWTCTCECGPIFPLSKLQVHAQLLSLGRINFEWRGGIGWLFPQQMCDQQWFLS